MNVETENGEESEVSTNCENVNPIGNPPVDPLKSADCVQCPPSDLERDVPVRRGDERFGFPPRISDIPWAEPTTAEEPGPEAEILYAAEDRMRPIELDLEQLNLTLDNFDNPNVVPPSCPYVLTSPRSLESCRLLGIQPVELLPVSLQEYESTFSSLNRDQVLTVWREVESEREAKLELARRLRRQLAGDIRTPRQCLSPIVEVGGRDSAVSNSNQLLNNSCDSLRDGVRDDSLRDGVRDVVLDSVRESVQSTAVQEEPVVHVQDKVSETLIDTEDKHEHDSEAVVETACEDPRPADAVEDDEAVEQAEEAEEDVEDEDDEEDIDPTDRVLFLGKMDSSIRSVSVPTLLITDSDQPEADQYMLTGAEDSDECVHRPLLWDNLSDSSQESELLLLQDTPSPSNEYPILGRSRFLMAEENEWDRVGRCYSEESESAQEYWNLTALSKSPHKTIQETPDHSCDDFLGPGLPCTDHKDPELRRPGPGLPCADVADPGLSYPDARLQASEPRNSPGSLELEEAVVEPSHTDLSPPHIRDWKAAGPPSTTTPAPPNGGKVKRRPKLCRKHLALSIPERTVTTAKKCVTTSAKKKAARKKRLTSESITDLMSPQEEGVCNVQVEDEKDNEEPEVDRDLRGGGSARVPGETGNPYVWNDERSRKSIIDKVFSRSEIDIRKVKISKQECRLLEIIAFKKYQEEYEDRKKDMERRRWERERRSREMTKKEAEREFRKQLIIKRRKENEECQRRLEVAREKFLESQVRLRQLLKDKDERKKHLIDTINQHKKTLIKQWREREEKRKSSVDSAVKDLLQRDTQYREQLNRMLEKKLESVLNRKVNLDKIKTEKIVENNRTEEKEHKLRMERIEDMYTRHIEMIRKTIEKKLRNANQAMEQYREKQMIHFRRKTQYMKQSQVISLKAELEAGLDLWRKQVLSVQSQSIRRAEERARTELERRREKLAEEMKFREKRCEERRKEQREEDISRIQSVKQKLQIKEKKVEKLLTAREENIMRARRMAETTARLREIIRKQDLTNIINEEFKDGNRKFTRK